MAQTFFCEFCEIFKNAFLQHASRLLLQDSSLNVHSYLDVFNIEVAYIWQEAALPRAIGFGAIESASFIWCIKAYMNLNRTKWPVNLFLKFEPQLGKSQLNNLGMKENGAFISYSFLSRKNN